MNERWAEFKVRYHAMQAEVEMYKKVNEVLKQKNDDLKSQIESIQGIVGCTCDD
jgi:cell division protein FtsB